MRTAGVLLPLLAALSGCSWMARPLEPPRVSLVDVRPLEMTLLEQRYQLQMRIQNPNPAPLSVEGMDYRVELNEREFAYGVSPQPFSVPAYGETVVDVDVVTNLAHLIDQFRGLSAARGEGFRYRQLGELSLTGFPGSLRFDQQGLLRLPPAEAADRAS
jgi:LEA14-like dessication related protein